MKQGLVPSLGILLLLWGCGKDPAKENPQPPPVNPPPPTDETRYTLRMWGAYWCTNCDSVIKNVNDELKEPIASGKLRIEVMVPPKKLKDEATSEDVAKCKEKIKLDLTYKPDSKWVIFKSNVSEENFGIPAGALFDKDEKRLSPYVSPVDPAKLAIDVRGRLK